MRGLDLHNKDAVHDHVQPLDAELLTLVGDAYAHLAPNIVAAGTKLALHGPDIDVFQKPVAQRVVDLVERTDHRVREVRLNQRFRRHGPYDYECPSSPRHRPTVQRSQQEYEDAGMQG